MRPVRMTFAGDSRGSNYDYAPGTGNAEVKISSPPRRVQMGRRNSVVGCKTRRKVANKLGRARTGFCGIAPEADIWERQRTAYTELLSRWSEMRWFSPRHRLAGNQFGRAALRIICGQFSVSMAVCRHPSRITTLRNRAETPSLHCPRRWWTVCPTT